MQVFKNHNHFCVFRDNSSMVSNCYYSINVIYDFCVLFLYRSLRYCLWEYFRYYIFVHTQLFKLYVLNKLFCFPSDVLFTASNFVEIPISEFIVLDFQTINMHLKCEWTIEWVFLINLTKKLRLASAGCFIYNLMIEFPQKTSSGWPSMLAIVLVWCNDWMFCVWNSKISGNLLIYFIQ